LPKCLRCGRQVEDGQVRTTSIVSFGWLADLDGGVEKRLDEFFCNSCAEKVQGEAAEPPSSKRWPTCETETGI